MGTSATQPAAPARDSTPPRKRRTAWIVWTIVAILAAIAIYYLRYDLRSYALMTRFADMQASDPIVRFEMAPIRIEDVTISGSDDPIRARLYLPARAAHPHGMVVVHGIHHLGIDDPRLETFARATAGAGIAVLTPEVTSLADYHVDAESIPTIGESAAWLENRLGSGPVTVTGVSFAGGLSLLAACDPRYAPHIRALVLMGAYDDLGRVSRFLATSEEEFPDGRTVPYAAHDYGASVFVYAHLPLFFTPPDLPAAHEALRYWLWEQPDKAKPLLDKLSPPGRAAMEALMERRIEAVRPRMLEAIREQDAEMTALSPRGRMDSLRAPVYIVHGSADNVIPPAESLWLAKDIPRKYVREVLITSALSHVDPRRHPPILDELRLVHFVGAVLRAAD